MYIILLIRKLLHLNHNRSNSFNFLFLYAGKALLPWRVFIGTTLAVFSAVVCFLLELHLEDEPI